MSDVRIVSLDPTHDVSEFASGEESIDRWLKRHALASQTTGTARTFVLLERESAQVRGYYALAAANVERSKATKPGRSGVGHSIESVPAVLLARLGRHEERRGYGYGPLLLADAVKRTVLVAANAGVRLMIVHALNEKARAWYVDHGFESSPIDHRLLMLTRQDLIAAVDDAGV